MSLVHALISYPAFQQIPVIVEVKSSSPALQSNITFTVTVSLSVATYTLITTCLVHCYFTTMSPHWTKSLSPLCLHSAELVIHGTLCFVFPRTHNGAVSSHLLHSNRLKLGLHYPFLASKPWFYTCYNFKNVGVSTRATCPSMALKLKWYGGEACLPKDRCVQAKLCCHSSFTSHINIINGRLCYFKHIM